MMVSRIFFAIWSILFLLFGYWQWNDPDPEVWISIYGFAAALSASLALNRYYLSLLVLAAIAAFVGGIYYFPSSVWDWVVQEVQQADLSMKTLEMEEARESFGLLIISVVMSLGSYSG